MTTSDDDRIAYLAGEGAGSLTAQERSELDELRGLLGAPATWEQPDPGLEDRVVAAIADEAQARPSSARARRPVFRRRPIFRRPAYAVAGFAAVVAAVVAIALAVGNSARAPTQFAMVVSGTPLAPGANGSATLTKTGSGWRIELSATGLPHLANGRYYEAWLKNAAGVLVPVGTFNDARQVTLWAGVPPTEYPALTVTRQQASGNPASSGERVLTGTVAAKH
jgi:Anti-sigma-K factor rskA, C-terminal